MSTDSTPTIIRAGRRGHGAATAAARSRAGTRAVGMVAVALAAVTSLAACGGGAASAAGEAVTAKTSLDPAAVAAQDAAFATAMFDHRHQALQLVGLVAQHGERSDVLNLARDLQSSYDTQMDDLETMLTGWGKTPPHVEGHTDLGDEIPGLLTAPELSALRAAKPAEFEKQFLTVLAGHEKRATATAQKELQLGADPQATAYAKEVVQQTTAHLTDIDAMLKQRA